MLGLGFIFFFFNTSFLNSQNAQFENANSYNDSTMQDYYAKVNDYNARLVPQVTDYISLKKEYATNFLTDLLYQVKDFGIEYDENNDSLEGILEPKIKSIFSDSSSYFFDGTNQTRIAYDCFLENLREKDSSLSYRLNNILACIDDSYFRRITFTIGISCEGFLCLKQAQQDSFESLKESYLRTLLVLEVITHKNTYLCETPTNSFNPDKIRKTKEAILSAINYQDL